MRDHLDISEVREEFSAWIRNYLDRPSEQYGGMKPCPFARDTWDSGRVRIHIGSLASVFWEAHDWDGSLDLSVVVFREGATSNLERECREYNQVLRDRGVDLVCIPFVPSDDDEEDPAIDPESWGATIDEAYGFVFIQELSRLNRASERLEVQGFYKSMSSEFMEYVQSRRNLETTDAR